MGLCRNGSFQPAVLLAALAMLLAAGCQTSTSVSVNRLIAHQALIDFSGLKAQQSISELKVAASIPEKWEKLPAQQNPLYFHQQWRSPSRGTGVGVAYVHMPLPMSAKAIIWFAKTQYAQQSTKNGKPTGSLINEWTDSVGREWFEAENAKFHVRGYAVTNGFDAWIVYSGYRLRDPMNLFEMSLASRAVDSILPTPLADQQPAGVTASR